MHIWGLVEPRKPLQMIEVPDPVPKGGEVIVAVSHCGLCHSDLHFWEGEYNLGGGKTMKITERGVTFPRAPGHEIMGEIVAVGPDAKGVAVGDRRVVYPWIGCGTCDRCMVGEENMCATMKPIGVVTDGGMASKVVVPDTRYLFDPGDIDPGLAATYACSGITVFGAIRKLEIANPKTPVVLLGAGGLGLAAIAMLKALDHETIVVVDVNPAKKDIVLEAGATAFVDGGAEDLSAALVEAVGGPVLYAIDFVNTGKTASATFESMGKGGRLVLVGAAGGDMNLPLLSMIFKPRAILGTAMGGLKDLQAVLDLAKSGKLKPTPVQRMPIEQVNDAFDALNRGVVTGRIVLEHSRD